MKRLAGIQVALDTAVLSLQTAAAANLPFPDADRLTGALDSELSALREVAQLSSWRHGGS